MRYPILLMSDLHLTEREVDSYRWNIFSWAIEQIKQYNIKELFILGDITDSKDKHTSLLVNKLVGNLARVAMYIPIKIIKGNHDYIDSDNPYMEFLNNISNIEFYSTWNYINIDIRNKKGLKVLFLPHTRNHTTDWQMVDFNSYDYIFMHQTVGGSLAANGFVLEEGMSRNYFGRKVYSGDIHVPQIIGDVEYIGAPYPIRFGDHYKARCLVLDLYNGKQKDLYFNTIKKDTIDLKIDECIDYDYYEKGDMVKIRINLKKSEYYKWQSIKKECIKNLENKGVIVSGVEVKEIKRENLIDIGNQDHNFKTLDDIFYRYVKKENIGNEYIEVGKGYL